MNVIILLKLLFAHVLSDFILQTDKLCEGKQREGAVRYGYQLLHSLTHAVVSYVLVAQWDNWILPVVLLVTHFVIDYVKSEYLKTTVCSFLVDQLLHVAVIVALWGILFNHSDISFGGWFVYWNTPRVWAVVIAYLLLLKPTSVLLSLFINRWMPKGSEDNSLQEAKEQSLPKAGQWIGYLERILILTFMLIGCLEGIGFLLAAKSIFRFGELNKAGEVRITEYVLIGTLASFTVAILVGVVLKSSIGYRPLM
jgi:hypothetical protein